LLSSSFAAYDPSVTIYWRNFVRGGSFFFTVNLANRGTTLLTERIYLLREAIRYTRARRPFTLEAIVVLAEHLYAIWTLPPGAGRRGLRNTVAIDQDGFLAGRRTERATVEEPAGKRRARDPAAPLLGTFHT